MKRAFKAVATTAIIGTTAFAAFKEKVKAAGRNEMTDPDYLLILGYRIDNEKIDEILEMRIATAADFLTKNPRTVAIPCGGKTGHNQSISEAQAIKNGLMERGIPEERIILEDRSLTTFENFINSGRIIQSRCRNISAARIAFMTSDFHVYRSSAICKASGLDAVGLPAPSPREKYKQNVIREFLVFPEIFIKKLKGI